MTVLDRIEAAKGDPDLLYAIAKELASLSDRPERQTWLTPSMKAWEAEMGKGTFPFGKAGKAFIALHRAGWSPEDIGGRLGFYLRSLKREGSVRYLSLPKFVETFGEWNPDEPAFDSSTE